jgi:hypothetical protein
MFIWAMASASAALGAVFAASEEPSGSSWSRFGAWHVGQHQSPDLRSTRQGNKRRVGISFV